MKISTKALRTTFSSLSVNQVDVLTVHPKEDGWHLRTITPDHVVMLDVIVGKDAFDGYEVWEPFGVKADTILESLSPAAEWTDVKVNHEGGRILLKADGITHRRALYPPEEALCRFPNVTDLSAEVMAPLANLMAVMTKGDPKHGTVQFECTGEAFRVSCLDADGTGAILELTAKECLLMEGTARSAYGLSSWMPFLKSLPKGVDLDMRLSDDFPMVVTVADGGVTVTFIVAPLLVED